MADCRFALSMSVMATVSLTTATALPRGRKVVTKSLPAEPLPPRSTMGASLTAVRLTLMVPEGT